MRCLTISLSALCLLACGPSEPAKYGPAKNDGVAANSASETRLAVGEQATTNVTPSASSAPPPAPSAGDPNAAMLAAMGNMPTPGGAAPDTSTPSTTTSGKTAPGKGGKTTGKTSSADTAATGKPTLAECKQTVDKYIDLVVANDPRFAGVPPEMLAQIKQSGITQATQKQGDPCADGKVTRAQYNCAMGATTTAAWEKCMK